MLISSGSKVLRLRTDGIPTMGRNTQGVRLMEMDPDERVVSVARVAERDADRPDPTDAAKED